MDLHDAFEKIISAIGTILIKEHFNEEVDINIYTAAIDLVAQLAIGASIAALGFALEAAFITTLPFTIACAILYSASAIIDFLIFNYTYNFLRRNSYC